MMPSLPDAILPVVAPFAPLFSQRLRGHAQALRSGAMLTPQARTLTAASTGPHGQPAGAGGIRNPNRPSRTVQPKSGVQ
jgi:hypothetical protein